MKKSYQPENSPVKVCKALLESYGWLVLRQKQIPVKGRTFTGTKGVPDFLAGRKGVCIGVEVKTNTGKLSEDQISFRAVWEAHGFKFYEFREPCDLIPILEAYNV